MKMKAKGFRIVSAAVLAISAAVVSFVGYGSSGTCSLVARDEYDFSMKLNVPQVVNNTKSKGSRKYQTQTVKGHFYVLWRSDGSYSFKLDGLRNTKLKVGGKAVTYKAYIDNEMLMPRFSWIGSNATKKFLTPTLAIAIAFEPSYAISEVGEDNSFYLLLSGNGKSSTPCGTRIATFLSGKASGIQGCSCADYGHVSPTRNATVDGPGKTVTDVVSTYGNWSVKWKCRSYCFK